MDYRSFRVRDCELSVRSTACLVRARGENVTLGEIEPMPDDVMAGLPGMTRRMVKEIREFIDSHKRADWRGWRPAPKEPWIAFEVETKSLRDQFALAAMRLVSDSHIASGIKADAEKSARLCYEIADAMMAERAKERQP